MAVRSNLSEEDARRVSAVLARLFPGSLMVASIDFSHYRSAAEARARDAETLSAIRSSRVGRILSFGNDNLDSPGSLAILLDTMRLTGASRFVLRANTDSSALGGSALGGVTSYIHGFFRPSSNLD
jgi:AmmeMemoRadiSam system protein B